MRAWVSLVSFNTVCFYSVNFSLVETCLGSFVVSWCWHLGKASPWESTALWKWPLPGGVWGALLMTDLWPLLEKPDIYNGLYLLGKMADSSIEQRKPVGIRSSTSQMVSLGKCLHFVISRRPENGLRFHSQHFDKMPRNKGYREIFISKIFVLQIF